jgi:hypothetical protein
MATGKRVHCKLTRAAVITITSTKTPKGSCIGRMRPFGITKSAGKNNSYRHMSISVSMAKTSNAKEQGSKAATRFHRIL